MWIDPNDPAAHRRRQRRRRRQSRTTGAATGCSRTPSRIGQFYNVSARHGRCRTTSAAACRTTGRGAARAGASRARSPTRSGSTSGGGDGFVTAQDPTEPEHHLLRVAGRQHRPPQLRDRRAHRARASRRGATAATCSGGLDQRRGPRHHRSRRRRRRRSGSRRSARRSARTRSRSTLRWNWNTPFFISPHNPATLYFGANRVLKCVKHGDEMFPISPDLSLRRHDEDPRRRARPPAASRPTRPAPRRSARSCR